MTEVSSSVARDARSVFCLSLHARYACRHSGACCETWEVAAERHVMAFVRERYGAGAARAFTIDAAAGAGGRIAHANGACVFRQQQRCALHRDGGERALPTGCRHFPRVVLRDARGTFIALSHYCPTAASLLAGHDPLEVVDGSSLRVCEPVEGLDARDALPPLLRPGMLMDLDAYDAWERSAIAQFGEQQNVSAALDAIGGATERIRGWSPGRGALRELVVEAFAGQKPEVRWRNGDRDHVEGRELRIVAELSRGSMPDDAGSDLAAVWHDAGGNETEPQQVLLRYLAARTFGNWIAYQGRGLRTIVSWLRACHDAVRVLALDERPRSRRLTPVTAAAVLEAVRRADLLMLHGIDSLAFARTAAAREECRA